MATWKRAVGGVLGLGVAALAALVGYVGITSSRMMSATFEVRPSKIEHPWPFDDADLAALRAEALAAFDGEVPPEDPLAGRDLGALRTKRARERGEALAIRLGCVDCHGEDLGGRTVMDVPPVMGILPPNITPAALGADYTIVEFERMVRHGVRRDGSAAFMPAIDTERLSDREVSDLFEYVLSRPSVDRPSGQSYWGPVMRALYAFGRVPPLAAHRIDHEASRPRVPPAKAANAEYGAHLAQTCRGCHRDGFEGGPIAGGDPDWPPAGNLTPHESGLASWTVDDFKTLMRTGVRPDGRAVDPKGMPWQGLSHGREDVELEAMFVYLRSLPPTPTGG